MRANDDKVKRSIEIVGEAYASVKRTLGSNEHKCTPDPDGKCKYCSRLVMLEPKGRTGELSEGL
jgi:hypothetical protein